MVLVCIKKYEDIRIFFSSILIEGKGANIYEMFIVVILNMISFSCQSWMIYSTSNHLTVTKLYQLYLCGSFDRNYISN